MDQDARLSRRSGSRKEGSSSGGEETGPLRISSIELAPELGEDFDRILDHVAGYNVNDAPSRIREIIRAIDVLEHNPLIGRPVDGGKRESIIGRRSRGYLALYRYAAGIDTGFVLALRSQQEAGYARD